MPNPLKRTGRKRSTLEVRFLDIWKTVAPTAALPVQEFRFHPTRQWRFDFCWPEAMVAVELDGGIFMNGAHNRGPQFAKDAEKHNAAVRLGWRLLKFNTESLRKEPVQCAELVLEVLKTAPRFSEPVKMLFV